MLTLVKVVFSLRAPYLRILYTFIDRTLLTKLNCLLLEIADDREDDLDEFGPTKLEIYSHKIVRLLPGGADNNNNHLVLYPESNKPSRSLKYAHRPDSRFLNSNLYFHHSTHFCVLIEEAMSR